jgi:Ni/Co efflux regulator RcnB
MNILKTIAAAGLLLSTATIATSADAQDYRHGGDRYGHHDRDRDRGWDRGYDRGRHGWNNHRRCWTEWRWHHRVRVCR